VPDLYHLLCSERYDVILITETWLSDRIPNSLIAPSNLYTVMRRNRQGSPRGGVCAFITKPFCVTEVVLDGVYSSVELNCFDVHYCDCSVRFFNVYRLPNSECSECMNTLTDCFINSWNVKGPCVIAGDFDCPNIDWANLTVPHDGVHDILLRFAINNGLCQMVNKPMRESNILDIILCNEPQTVSDFVLRLPLSNSDHHQVEFTVFIDGPNSNTCNTFQTVQYD